MEISEIRALRQQLGLSDQKINHKTGVHLGVIERFFSGQSDELTPRERLLLEQLMTSEQKKRRIM